jgi:hypothetical protein
MARVEIHRELVNSDRQRGDGPDVAHQLGTCYINCYIPSPRLRRRTAWSARVEFKTVGFGRRRTDPGGEGGIRTHEGLLNLTRFPGERPKPD